MQGQRGCREAHRRGRHREALSDQAAYAASTETVTGTLNYLSTGRVCPEATAFLETRTIHQSFERPRVSMKACSLLSVKLGPDGYMSQQYSKRKQARLGFRGEKYRHCVGEGAHGLGLFINLLEGSSRVLKRCIQEKALAIWDAFFFFSLSLPASLILPL